MISPRITQQTDGITPIDKTNILFALRIKNGPMKEAVGKLVNIVTPGMLRVRVYCIIEGRVTCTTC